MEKSLSVKIVERLDKIEKEKREIVNKICQYYGTCEKDKIEFDNKMLEMLENIESEIFEIKTLFVQKENYNNEKAVDVFKMIEKDEDMEEVKNNEKKKDRNKKINFDFKFDRVI